MKQEKTRRSEHLLEGVSGDCANPFSKSSWDVEEPFLSTCSLMHETYHEKAKMIGVAIRRMVNRHTGIEAWS